MRSFSRNRAHVPLIGARLFRCMHLQAVAALPEALQQEARLLDLTLLPIQRRIFTETAPIPDFQAKLLRPAGQE